MLSFFPIYSTTCTPIYCRSFLFSRKTPDANDPKIPNNIDSIERDVATSSPVKKNKPPTLRDVPKLTKELTQTERPEDSVLAAKKLYELCDVGHKQNREPLVASGKYDVLNPLAACLVPNTTNGDGVVDSSCSTFDVDRLHFVLLTLNNLSIPHDNKRVMVLERGSRKLIGNLCKVVARGRKDTHLALIVLMNLSFFEPAEVIIGQFSPKHSLRGPRLTPLENPDSLLRILQDLTAHAARVTSDFRWAFGLLANLSKNAENALLIGLTGIPRMAIENIAQSKIPPSEWKTNSLEDFSLYLLLHLAEASKDGLDGALEVAEPIMEQDSKGIQGLKATMLCAFLSLPWDRFPNYGVNAAASVMELMGNTFERVGKKHTYTDNDFSLRTAVSAYTALCKRAAKADALAQTNQSKTKSTDDSNGDDSKDNENEGDEGDDGNSVKPSTEKSSKEKTATEQHISCAKVMALPTSIALLFQIINAIAEHWGEDEGDESFETYHWDIKAGELAVGAIMALLPALLQAENPPRTSVRTEYACADLSKIFVFFSKKTSSISVKARASEVAEKLTMSAAGNALPLLEASYDLWQQHIKIG
jgi:hypothetical protein